MDMLFTFGSNCDPGEPIKAENTTTLKKAESIDLSYDELIEPVFHKQQSDKLNELKPFEVQLKEKEPKTEPTKPSNTKFFRKFMSKTDKLLSMIAIILT